MDILIALIPAIGWGIVPLIVNKVKGQPVNQILGMSIGAVIVGAIVAITNGMELNVGTFFLAMLAGALWTIGQIGQFVSFTRMGVSSTIPLSTGFQLVGNSLIGVLIFGEWAESSARILGVIALVLVVIGVISTSVSDNRVNNGITITNIGFLLVTTIGYWIYSSFPKMVSANGQNLILPEMLGILVGALIYMLATKKSYALAERTTWLNLFAGIAFGIGSLFYIYSVKANGVAAAFIYSQLSSIIATFGGIWLLKEAKTHREMLFTVLGLLLIVGGSALTGMIG